MLTRIITLLLQKKFVTGNYKKTGSFLFCMLLNRTAQRFNKAFKTERLLPELFKFVSGS